MANINPEKMQALQTALDKINAKGAKKNKDSNTTVSFLGDVPKAKVRCFSTGSPAVNIALGIGGLPEGRIIEIYGPESSGKTTLSLNTVASVQREGGIAAFIDVEHALDPEWAAKLGVDVGSLLFAQPDSGEEALNLVEDLVQSQAVDLIVVDSVAALVPQAELDGEIGDSHVGRQARMMSQALRKLTAISSRSNTAIIFINQLREKIGVMFGSPETTTGGKALKFYASVRMDIRRVETLKDSTSTPVGSRIKVKIVKNKVAAPFKVAETDILYNHGFSREGDILDLAVANNLIKKSGAWFADAENKTQIGQGRERAREFLMDNPEYTDELEEKIYKILNINGSDVEESTEVEEVPEDLE